MTSPPSYFQRQDSECTGECVQLLICVKVEKKMLNYVDIHKQLGGGYQVAVKSTPPPTCVLLPLLWKIKVNYLRIIIIIIIIGLNT